MATDVASAPAMLRSTIFVGHGSPQLPELDIPARQFLRNIGKELPRPKAILCVSAHWMTSAPSVTAADRMSTIHDFWGFPAHMYEWKYPVPGSPRLAERVAELLTVAGFGTSIDRKRGLDHGAWIPLSLMYPDADIPVVQLSIQPDRSPRHHVQMGRALSALREEGVLVLGSGNVTHNLRELRFSGPVEVPNYATRFDDWTHDTLIHGKVDDLCDYLNKAPEARRAHPTPDHFLPLHVTLGAAGESPRTKRIHSSFSGNFFSMAAYEFEAAEYAAAA
ncbi:hypothetical protein CBR_g30352 [Chara braunii]|uniref:Extradiol ring-cleavage dioxygenase class III enzyme subunit B domain-containing protein n=1 Tax=Chara braunii TaxID=69332 RepID=A0A388JX72_CHABU|nr:hypothetical protein CBR_g30352 [Chara braunii]|eukprot:GBG62399.1 hypothetical protein CBR_g30352 [Chara braunii]